MIALALTLGAAILGSYGQLVVLILALQLLRGEETYDAPTALRQGLVWLFPFAVLGILIGVQILLYSLLLLIPGIVRAMTLYVAQAEWVLSRLAGAPLERRDAMAVSAERMPGRRGQALVVSVIASMPVILLTFGSVVMELGRGDLSNELLFWFDLAMYPVSALASLPIVVAQAIFLVQLFGAPTWEAEADGGAAGILPA
ncbi:MAG: hypothetical protein GY898_05390 [Proteobacteria bacterium]|nr:hypothetical protein [Pseudomonadota bacterium]